MYNYFLVRKKPRVIQMPITSRCNSRCKTCNVWKYHDNIDMDPTALEQALKDDFFSDVVSVGLNGGEFTLIPNFTDIVRAVLTLPSIRNIHLISNGLFPKRLFEYLTEAKRLCDKRDVRLNICISVDGVGPIHENVRGIPNCFGKTRQILDELTANHAKYCHGFSAGCTISKHNVEHIQETEQFLSSYGNLRVEYHCAIPNKRIKTFDDADYCVFDDAQKRLLAAEFFFKRYRNAKSAQERFQNFANYHFLKSDTPHRLTCCDYRNRDVTIDESLNLMLCATASDVIGNLKEHSATELAHSPKCKQILKEICAYCDHCGHYSYHPLNFKGRKALIREELTRNNALHYYHLSMERNWVKRLMKKTRFRLSLLKQYLRYTYIYLWKLQ